MNKERLTALERRVQQCTGAHEVAGTTNRNNEPVQQWFAEDTQAIDALMERGGLSQQGTVLNMNTCRGQASAERPGVITGIDGLVLEMYPKESIEVAKQVREIYGDTPTAREVAAEVLDLDTETAEVMLEGPNWAGQARAWIQPHEAAQAIHHVVQGMEPERVWGHLDRKRLANAHEAENPDGYLEHEVTARTEQWMDMVEELGHDPETQTPAAEVAQIDINIERLAIIEDLRGRQAWDSIAATAEIAPSAQLGHGIHVGAYASIDEGAVLDNYSRVEDNASIGQGTRIGSEVVVREGATIGRDCAIDINIGPNVEVGDQCVLAADADRKYLAEIPAGSKVPDQTVLAGRGSDAGLDELEEPRLGTHPAEPANAPAQAVGAHQAAAARTNEQSHAQQH